MPGQLSSYLGKNVRVATKTSELQRQIDAATAAASATMPQVVLVGPGTHISDLDMSSAQYVSLIGLDCDACIIQGVGDLELYGPLYPTINLGSNCKVANLSIRAASKVNSQGIAVGDNHGAAIGNITIEDCRIEGLSATGNIDSVYTGGNADIVTNLVLRRLICTSGFDGFQLQACPISSPATVEHCTVLCTSSVNNQTLRCISGNGTGYFRVSDCDLRALGLGVYTLDSVGVGTNLTPVVAIDQCMSGMWVKNSRLYAAVTSGGGNLRDVVAILSNYDDTESGESPKFINCMVEGHADIVTAGIWRGIYHVDDGSGGVKLYGCSGEFGNALGIRYRDAKAICLLDKTISVPLTVDGAYAKPATNMPLQLPPNSILRGFLIETGTLGGTAGAGKTIDYAVGSVANADTDIVDATDCDVMVAAGAKTAASIHGDAALDNVAAYYTNNDDDPFGKYLADWTTIYFNLLGKCDDATPAVTLTVPVKIWAFVDCLP